jgi:hypothetical protein
MTLRSKESFLGTEFKGEIAISSIKGLALKDPTSSEFRVLNISFIRKCLHDYHDFAVCDLLEYG